jgi:hypothetical protein
LLARYQKANISTNVHSSSFLLGGAIFYLWVHKDLYRASTGNVPMCHYNLLAAHQPPPASLKNVQCSLCLFLIKGFFKIWHRSWRWRVDCEWTSRLKNTDFSNCRLKTQITQKVRLDLNSWSDGELTIDSSPTSTSTSNLKKKHPL